MLNYIRSIVVYHVQKKYKKRFSVNNQKYLLYIVFMGIFCTFCNASQESTSTAQSTQIKKENNSDQAQEAPKKPKGGLFNKIAALPRCPYSTTPLRKLNQAQLEEVYAYTETHQMDAPFVIDLLERLITLSDNHAGVKRYKLELAELHYKVKHIEKAAAYYEDFGVMYPSSKEAEYVLYKAFMCMFQLSLEPDRDQTNTKKTIVLVKEFLKRAKNTELIAEANDIMQQCYQRLYDHEVYVFNFYTKKKNFVAAQLRLDYIAKNFTTMIKDLTTKVEQLTMQLELAQNPVKISKQNVIKKLIA